ncbi:hypothetical protein Tco_0703953 [Tanacetum coccineum]|uniref:Integrase catalytic domain-containing protein n=1 Tax=Tanacetum coccineum TaxID=301880 RepID=A0ABQ4Y254_9ASTR
MASLHPILPPMARANQSTKSCFMASTFIPPNLTPSNDLGQKRSVTASQIQISQRNTFVPHCKKKQKDRAQPPKPDPIASGVTPSSMIWCSNEIASIMEKRYVLVIVVDYSRYTWVHFLRSKDEAPEVIKTFLKRITVLLQSPIWELGANGDLGFFIKLVYSADSYAYKVQIPGLQRMTSGTNHSGLDLTYLRHQQNNSKNQLKVNGFSCSKLCMMIYWWSKPSSAPPRTAPIVSKPHQALQTPTATTTTADTAPTPTNSSSQATNFPNSSQDVDELETQQHVQHQPATIAKIVPKL